MSNSLATLGGKFLNQTWASTLRLCSPVQFRSSCSPLNIHSSGDQGILRGLKSVCGWNLVMQGGANVFLYSLRIPYMCAIYFDHIPSLFLSSSWILPNLPPNFMHCYFFLCLLFVILWVELVLLMRTEVWATTGTRQPTRRHASKESDPLLSAAVMGPCRSVDWLGSV